MVGWQLAAVMICRRQLIQCTVNKVFCPILPMIHRAGTG